MSTLNQAALDAAYHAFVAHPGDSRPSVEAAIRTYMAVTTPSPVKMIGGLSHDPREAVSGAMVPMLEKEPANG